MADGFGELAVSAVEPVARVMRDVEFAVGIGGQAMMAGFVVRARAVDGGVVLGDVEIYGPGAQSGGEGFQGVVEAARVGPVPIGRQNGVFRGIVAEDVEKGVGQNDATV